MDELLELIIRGVMALFDGGGSARKPPPAYRAPGPPMPPARPRVPLDARRLPSNPRLQQAQQEMMQRQQAMQRQRMMSNQPQRPPGMVRGRVPPPPPARRTVPVPQPATAPELTPPAQAVVQTPATATRPPAAAVSADAIRQLIRTRPTATRTMWVLSEVFGPPLALRGEIAALQ